MSNIISAKYGGILTNKSAYKDVTTILHEQLSQGITSIEVSNRIFGDPAFGVVKHLIIEYPNAVIKVFKEGSIAKLMIDAAVRFDEPQPIDCLIGLKTAEIEFGCPEPFDDSILNLSTEKVVYNTSITNTYDVVYLPNILHRCINPLQVLLNCKRLSSHYILIVVPCKQYTGDHDRSTTTFIELENIYRSSRGEDDVRDWLNAILSKYDISKDPTVNTMEELIIRSLHHKDNHQLHVHVFDVELVTACLQYIGYTVMLSQMWKPCHQIILGKK